MAIGQLTSVLRRFGQSRALPFAAALSVLMATGAIRRQEGGEAAENAQASAAVTARDLLPAEAGSWSGPEAEVDRKGLEGAGVAALAARRYRDTRTGRAVTAVLLCGRPGPVAAHGPESCYPGLGFAQTSEAQRVRVPGLDAAFWSATFVGGNSAAPRRLRVHWTWGRPGAWSAPESPRVTFAGATVLWKLYLLDEPDPTSRSDAPLDLAAALLPAIDTSGVQKP